MSKVGDRVNIERALTLAGRLDGPLVSGHVDGVAEVVAMREEGDSTRVTLRAPETVFFSWDTVLANDVTVEPNVVFGKPTSFL